MPSLAEPRRIVLSHEPLVEAAPLEVLGLPAIPTESHFKRNHFRVPVVDPDVWRLQVTGAGGRPLTVALTDLQRLPPASAAVVLECAGHRRAEYEPAPQGIGWGVGAMSEAVWAGVRLGDLLDWVDQGEATHVVLEGADAGPVGADQTTTAFARAIPLEKALDDTLLAWEMNGKQLPVVHGAPLRAIVPGWYATDSVKWLTSIRLQSRPFEGHFEAVDYQVPDESGEGSRRLTTLPISSLLTSHADGAALAAGPTRLRGVAWGAKGSVASVEVSVDGGEWAPAFLDRSPSPYGRVFWSLDWHAEVGQHTVRVRATDWHGITQPERPSWNPRGFANSSVQRTVLDVR